VTPILASAFGTFMLFVALGLGTLAVTAVLDSLLGKERALLLYAVGLLALTALVLRPTPAAGSGGKAKPEKLIATLMAPRALATDLVGRPSFLGAPGSPRRNGFERYTDTRALPPIVLEVPPSIPLDFPLPPTIPGPGPAARRLLRGTVPVLPEEDASTLPEVPPVTFTEYEVHSEDVYDWVDHKSGAKVYVAIVTLNGVRRDDPKFRDLQRQLVSGDELDKLNVEWANIGGEKEASKNLDPELVLRRSKQNRQVNRASDPLFLGWHARRSVENEYDEALRTHLPGEPVETTKQVNGLRNAAEQMAKVGRTGKQGGEGWKRAAHLLERALAVARVTLGADTQAEILVALIEAYRALNDETAVLRALTEYAAAAPNSVRPWLWLGQLALEKMHLPEEALSYFAKARALDSGNEEGALGEGDAFTRLGRHAEALAAYGKAGGTFAANVRRAEAALRVGDLKAASAASDAALGSQPDAPRALLVRGAVLYAKGADLRAAKSAFQMAADSTAEAGVWRAQALYDLGLTCWRLGETRAAINAFDGCDAALRMGAAPSRLPDETVSPSLGRALVAFALRPAPPPEHPAAGPAPADAKPLGVSRERLGEYLAAARDEARRCAYLEHFAGVLASGQENMPAAIKALRRSLLLAPDSSELDGWLAVSHLRWAFTRASRPESASTGVSRDREERRLENILSQPAAEHFEAAVAFAARASQGDLAADPKSYLALLRETWVQLQAEHLSPRKRFEAALATVDRVLGRPEQREQPAALALRAYAYYRLGGEENYGFSLRDFGLVLDKVPSDKPDAPWLEWRAYALKTLARVSHWLSLEEKVISFEGLSQLTKDWIPIEKGGGVQVLVEGGALAFQKSAERVGTIAEPVVVVLNQTLFEKGTFEELRLRIRIPIQENNIVFGVAVQGTTATSGPTAGAVPARHAGIAVFYDKGKVAARIGTGFLPDWKEWPAGEWVTIRIALEDRVQGLMSVYLNDDEVPVISDKVGGFKGSTGKAELWIGGWSAQQMLYDVKIKDIRVVRVKAKK
jgi:tetratricopeptide (TPR) repeat protein